MRKQLQSAHNRKKTHQLPTSATRTSGILGRVAILPWVVGVRGLVKKTHLKAALEFLAIPTKAWKPIPDTSVRMSAEGFAFLNQIRVSTSQARTKWGALDGHGTDEQGGNANSRANGKQKRAESGREDLGDLVVRWKHMAKTRRRHKGALDGNRRAKRKWKTS